MSDIAVWVLGAYLAFLALYFGAMVLIPRVVRLKRWLTYRPDVAAMRRELGYGDGRG